MVCSPRKIGIKASPKNKSSISSIDSSRLPLSLNRKTSSRAHWHCIAVVFLLACLIGLQPLISSDGGQEMELIDNNHNHAINEVRSSASSEILVDNHQPRRPTTFDIHPNKCESPLHSRAEFDRVYKNGIWTNNQPLRKPADFYNNAHWPPSELSRTSASGGGSARGSETENSLLIILDTIEKYNVTSMIDVPCGDVNWIFDSYATDTLPVYIGLDVSDEVLQLNRLRLGHHVNKHFYLWDAVSCTLPKYRDVTPAAAAAGAAVVENDSGGEDEGYKSVDLVHVRDVIQHLSLAQGVQYFCNVFRSGARVLITTSYNDFGANRDVVETDWYQNNLQLEPFSFPERNCVFTHPDHEPDYTCVYDLTEDWIHQFVAEKCSL